MEPLVWATWGLVVATLILGLVSLIQYLAIRRDGKDRVKREEEELRVLSDQASALAASARAMERQVDTAKLTDSARRWETQILEIEPTLAEAPSLSADRRLAIWQVILNGAAFKLRGELSGLGESLDPLKPVVVSSDMGSWPPGGSPMFSFGIAPLMKPDADGSGPFGDPWTFSLSYTGPLGQEVIEDYRWNVASADNPNRLVWQLIRFHVKPKVEGTEPLNLEFEVS